MNKKTAFLHALRSLLIEHKAEIEITFNCDGGEIDPPDADLELYIEGVYCFDFPDILSPGISVKSIDYIFENMKAHLKGEDDENKERRPD